MTSKNDDFNIGWIGVIAIGTFAIGLMWHVESQRQEKFKDWCVDKLVWSIRTHTDGQLGEIKEELVSESTLEICRDLYPDE